jgi:replication factor C subunit 1
VEAKMEKKATKTKRNKNDDFVVIDDDFDDDFGDDDDDVEFLEELDSLKKSSPMKSTRSTRGKSQDVIELSPEKPIKELETEPIKVESPKKDTHKKSSKTAPPKKLSAITSSPKKLSKTIASPKKSKTTTTTTGRSALEILSTIPDAELPEDQPSQPFNYQQFKSRQSTTVASTIELPKGASNCLTGLTMVFTGVMPNLGRDEAEGLAKEYGAKVTKSISSKTSVVVIGEEAGPSKIKKIKQFKIKAIDEGGFIQLIQGMPEEGGSGELAEKARLKRQEEEEKTLQESIKMEKEAEEEAKKRDELIKKAQREGRQVHIKNDDEKLWTVKYAPSRLDQLCGNKSTIEKLKRWLETWHQKFHGKPTKGESDFRAVLIHGPPGVGKTTAAHLVAKSLGYDVIEKNASDVRSKNLLNQEIGNILDNTSVMGFFKKNEVKSENNNKFVIIMDEVDGMSGGDRGGVGALASYAKKTQVPMILICNDKSLPKMRPFDRVTMELPFRRPSAREMKSRLMTIALREGIKLDPNMIDQLVATTSNDIRQIINLLSTISMTQKSIDSKTTKNIDKDWSKNIALKPFDIIPRLLSPASWNGTVPLYKKMEWYFDDHSFVPLMMAENYINSKPRAQSKLQGLEMIGEAADSISLGDLVDKRIHSSEQLWSLMPLHAIMSTVKPAGLVNGGLSGRVNFSSWLGQNSKAGKYSRLLKELNYDTKLRTFTDATELRLEYIPVLVKRLLKPVLEGDIPAAMEILDHYYLSKTDWDSLMEFTIGVDDTTASLKKIPASAKSKFTRLYNKEIHPVAIYRAGMFDVTKGKKKKDEEEDETPEEEPDLVEDLE